MTTTTNFRRTSVALFLKSFELNLTTKSSKYGGPQLSRQKQITRVKSKSLASKANHSRQKQITRVKSKSLASKANHSRQKQNTRVKSKSLASKAKPTRVKSKNPLKCVFEPRAYQISTLKTILFKTSKKSTVTHFTIMVLRQEKKDFVVVVPTAKIIFDSFFLVKFFFRLCRVRRLTIFKKKF